MDTLTSILAYWWVALIILAAVGHKWILRVLFGMVVIPKDKIGLVTRKFILFGGKPLADGRIIASDGEAGYQIDTLAPGDLKWWYWIWQYDITLQEFVVIPKGKIGLVNAKDGAQLPTGQILARSVECNNFMDARAFFKNGGQKGKQIKYLNSGTYRINTLLFDVVLADITIIGEGQMGVITAQDGRPLTGSQIAGDPVNADETNGHNNFQDFDKFLTLGGQRGLQTQYILAGSYSLNPWAVSIESIPMVEIPIGNVGIIISYVGDEGKDVTGTDFKHGNIVGKGQKGVWETPLDPGKYAINNYTTKIQIVPTTNLVLNWATGRNEAHNLDKNLSTITVRSKDGYAFNLDVSQIIHIPSSEAPKVIARFGSVQNLVSQVLEPLIGNYFRNSAQNDDVISFLSSRQERQNSAKEKISDALKEYNVHAVDTLIGDINPPASLMETLTNRKLAQEQQKTYVTEMEAQKTRQVLASETALADMQGEIVAATQSVAITERKAEATVKEAEGKSQSIKLNADAEAYKIEQLGIAEAVKVEKIGSATAEAYKKQVDAMGPENFSKFKIFEEIGKNNTKIIPDILISGGDGNNPLSGLASIEMLNYLQTKKNESSTKQILKD